MNTPALKTTRSTSSTSGLRAPPAHQPAVQPHPAVHIPWQAEMKSQQQPWRVSPWKSGPKSARFCQGPQRLTVRPCRLIAPFSKTQTVPPPRNSHAHAQRGPGALPHLAPVQRPGLHRSSLCRWFRHPALFPADFRLHVGHFAGRRPATCLCHPRRHARTQGAAHRLPWSLQIDRRLG